MKGIRIILVAMVLASCAGPSEKETEKPVISVTILPQQYFVEQIAGELFEVNVMIPPGASPATYEPSPAQLAALQRTRIYFRMGYTGFEMSWMEKLARTNPGMKIVNLSDGVDLIMERSPHERHDDHHESATREQAEDGGHHHGGIDPHTWLSPKNVKIISKNILESLSAAYPEYRNQFESGYREFSSRLEDLDSTITAELASAGELTFFTYHPSLSYYARDYGLKQIPLELMGKSPSASYLRELVDIGKSEKIEIIFLQIQFDQHNAEVLAREVGAEIIQINPLDPEWYEQMLFITRKLTGIAEEDPSS